MKCLKCGDEYDEWILVAGRCPSCLDALLQYKGVSIGNGWECPRCHKIHAPFISGCDCPVPYIIKTATNTQSMGDF